MDQKPKWRIIIFLTQRWVRMTLWKCILHMFHCWISDAILPLLFFFLMEAIILGGNIVTPVNSYATAQLEAESWRPQGCVIMEKSFLTKSQKTSLLRWTTPVPLWGASKLLSLFGSQSPHLWNGHSGITQTYVVFFQWSKQQPTVDSGHGVFAIGHVFSLRSVLCMPSSGARQLGLVQRSPAWGLGLNPDSVIYKLSDLRQIAQPLCSWPPYVQCGAIISISWVVWWHKWGKSLNMLCDVINVLGG